MTETEYREINRLAGYRFGDDGSVWSRYHGDGKSGTGDTWRKLVPGDSPRRYYVVSLLMDGKQKLFYVHRLILEAFFGPCPSGMQCCHNDGNRRNNRASNLRWDTPSANALDKFKHGTQASTFSQGSRNRNAKLTESDIIEIRSLRLSGLKQYEIAERFNVCRPTITHILRGTYWSHV